MIRRVFITLIIPCIFCLAGVGVADEAAKSTNDTAQWMIEQETAWAEQSCGGPWVLSELLAADFHGTSPKGTRYDKPKTAPTYDPATQFHTDCRLLGADVRFFSSDVAVVYGSESSVAPLPDAGHERRCLVWTDTWLRRDGKWQIIAVQDARVECPST